MAGQRYFVREAHSPSIAASGSFTLDMYFPRNVRVTKYYAVATATEAAHVSQILSAVFTNKGTNGSGSTVLATFTNDSAQSDDIAKKTGTWTANVAKEIDCGNRPGAPTATQNAWDSIAAASVVQVVISKGAGTQTGFVSVGIEGNESS